MRKQKNLGPQTCAVHLPGELGCDDSCRSRLRAPDASGLGLAFRMADGSTMTVGAPAPATSDAASFDEQVHGMLNQFDEEKLYRFLDEHMTRRANAAPDSPPAGQPDLEDGNTASSGDESAAPDSPPAGQPDEVGPASVEEMDEAVEDIERRDSSLADPSHSWPRFDGQMG